MDTVENAILNSAEIVFENELGDFAPPAQFQFRVLDDENKYRSFLLDTLIDGIIYQPVDLELKAAYINSVTFENSDGTMDLRNDALEVAYVKPGTTNLMATFLTSFFQDQYAQRNNEKRIRYGSLHPIESQFRKSVNRMVLSDNIKLKIYYTTPVVETKE
jgi:hypothetical protein